MRERAAGRLRRPRAPSRGDVLRGIAAELEAAGLESPRLEAERLLAHVLGISRSDLLLGATESLDPGAAGALAQAMARRLDREPLQHIEGRVAFRELVLVSDGRALIPRPETEQLLDGVRDWIGGRAPVARALDIGTGSGAIALSLLREGLAEFVVALDTSAAALAQAEENVGRAGIEESRLDMRLCPAEIWSALDPSEQFDFIVSNPPYVEEAAVESLPKEIRRFEPRGALNGGADGLEVIRTIVSGAGMHLFPGGGLFLEIGEGQGAGVRTLLEDAAVFEAISVGTDLSGRVRFVSARRSHASDARE